MLDQFPQTALDVFGQFQPRLGVQVLTLFLGQGPLGSLTILGGTLLLPAFDGSFESLVEVHDVGPFVIEPARPVLTATSHVS